MKWLWLWLLGLFTVAPVSLPSPAATPVLQEFGGFQYSQVVIDNLSRLQLFSNLKARQSSTQLKQLNQCQTLTSAGFYDTNYQHLGWFQVGGMELSPQQNNQLFDGFLSISSGRAELDFRPRLGADYGLQSGPMLVYDGKPLKLTIKADQPRRRVVAALTGDNQLIFMVILSPDSNYAGPLLAETPKLVLGINPAITAAINLDGGSASAFLSQAVSLLEYSPIGGYFCYTKL